MCIRDSFYTVALELPGLTVSGERMADKAAAEQLKEVCQGAAVTIKKVECKEKSEKPPVPVSYTHLIERACCQNTGGAFQSTGSYRKRRKDYEHCPQAHEL